MTGNHSRLILRGIIGLTQVSGLTQDQIDKFQVKHRLKTTTRTEGVAYSNAKQWEEHTNGVLANHRAEVARRQV